MKWWREARFGMFIHFGLCSLVGRGEQVQIQECIPHKGYDRLARKFRPRPGAPREWARLAKATGMKYMVLTTKHHDGFCLWNTKQTEFNTVKTACGRDIVQLLGKVSAGGGNLLLNIGPAPDGGVPAEFIEPLAGVAGWLRENGRAAYGALARGTARWGATACGVVSRKGNKAYFWAFNRAAPEMGLGGYETRLKSARLLADGRKIAFEQKGYRIRLKDLPLRNPDKWAGIPVIELEFVSPPKFWFRPDLDALNVVLPPPGWVESRLPRMRR